MGGGGPRLYAAEEQPWVISSYSILVNNVLQRLFYRARKNQETKANLLGYGDLQCKN